MDAFSQLRNTGDTTLGHARPNTRAMGTGQGVVLGVFGKGTKLGLGFKCHNPKNPGSPGSGEICGSVVVCPAG